MDFNSIKDEAKELNQQGEILMQSNQKEEAYKKFIKAMDIDPMMPDSYQNLGIYYASIGKYEEAKNMLKKAMMIEKNPYYSFLYGNICVMNDELANAITSYQQAVQLGYDSATIMFFIAKTYQALNEYAMALRYYQKAIQKDPIQSVYRRHRISLLIGLKEYEQAEKEADDYITNLPDDYDAYYLKILLLRQQKKKDEVYAFTKKVSCLFPEDAGLLSEYISSCIDFHQIEEAKRLITFAKSLKHYEKDQHKIVRLEAIVLGTEEKYDEAIALIEQYLNINDIYDMDLSLLLIRLYVNAKKYEELKAYSQKMISLKHFDQLYFASIYYECFAMKQLNEPEAKTNFKKANSLYRMYSLDKPDLFELYVYRVMCLKEIEEYDKAIELIDFVISTGANHIKLHEMKAEIYDLQGRTIKAKEEREIVSQLSAMDNE